MMTTNHLALSLPAVPASVRSARMSAGEAAAQLGASERVVDDVRLCVSEAVSNVVRHAYGTQQGDVEVVLDQEEDRDLTVVVRDEGQGMSSAEPTEMADEGPDGGYGLKFIEKLTRHVTITSTRDAGTEVRMVFSLDAPQA